MKKLVYMFVSFLVLYIAFFLLPAPSHAAVDCSIYTSQWRIDSVTPAFDPATEKNSITIRGNFPQISQCGWRTPEPNGSQPFLVMIQNQSPVGQPVVFRFDTAGISISETVITLPAAIYTSSTQYSIDIYYCVGTAITNGTCQLNIASVKKYPFAISNTSTLNCSTYVTQWRIDSVVPNYSGGKVGFVINGNFPKIASCGWRNVPPNTTAAFLILIQNEANGTNLHSYKYAESGLSVTETKITLPAIYSYSNATTYGAYVYYCIGSAVINGTCGTGGFNSVNKYPFTINDPTAVASPTPTFTPTPAAFVAAPTNLTFECKQIGTGSSAFVQTEARWQTVPGVAGYQRQVVNVTSGGTNSANISSTICPYAGACSSVVSADSAKTYYVKVRAYNANNVYSAYAQSVQVTCPTLPTPAGGCTCVSGDSCSSACTFNKQSSMNYSNPIKCALSSSYFSTVVTQENKNAWCNRPQRTKGDASGDGGINLMDYFYHVAARSGGKIPRSVNVDYDGNGLLNTSDIDYMQTGSINIGF